MKSMCNVGYFCSTHSELSNNHGIYLLKPVTPPGVKTQHDPQNNKTPTWGQKIQDCFQSQYTFDLLTSEALIFMCEVIHIQDA